MSIPYAIEGRIKRGQSGVQILQHILSRWLALIVMGVFTVNSESRLLTTTGMGVAWFRVLMVIGFLHIGNGCEAALATGGIIYTLVWKRYLKVRKKNTQLLVTVVASVTLLIAGMIANRFFITSKIMATAPWLFYNLSIMTMAYGVVAQMEQSGRLTWYKVLAPAGSSTLTCYRPNGH